MTYALVPARIRERDLLAERLQGLLILAFRGGGFLRRNRLGRSHRRWLCCWLGLELRLGLGLSLGLGVEAADLELALVLLQDALVVVLPELFGSILASDPLENLLTACQVRREGTSDVFVYFRDGVDIRDAPVASGNSYLDGLPGTWSHHRHLGLR